jgi:hypothetical protein
MPAFHIGPRVQPRETLGSQFLGHGGIGLRDVIGELVFVGLKSRSDLGVVDSTICRFFRCQDQFSPHPGQLGGRPLQHSLFPAIVRDPLSNRRYRQQSLVVGRLSALIP